MSVPLPSGLVHSRRISLAPMGVAVSIGVPGALAATVVASWGLGYCRSKQLLRLPN